jgi:hypothetical protein
MPKVVSAALAGVVLLVALGADTAEKPRVSMELVTEAGLAITGPQQWYKLLTGLGVEDLQIGSGNRADEPQIEERTLRGVKSYRLKGVIAANGTLKLPGGSFTTRDSAELKQYLAKLADAGEEGVKAKPTAFGLLPSQLAEVNQNLKRRVDFNTKGLSGSDALERLHGSLRLPMVFEPGATAALAEVTLDDEMKGLASGTAMAAILRPAGLTFRPERLEGGRLSYRVQKADAKSPGWPVGWQPEAAPGKVLPDLFESINAQIDDTPLAEVLSSIAERLKTPLLYDHNSLALKDIDPNALRSNLPAKRLPYALILRGVLSAAKLKYELRVDEAGKPFFWITVQ